MFTIVQNQCGKVLFLVSLGVNVYPWEIVGMDLVTSLYGLEFHFTDSIDSCLPSEMAHFLSCHKKSPLTKQRLFLLLIDIEFMVFHNSLCLTDNPALLANLAIFYEEIKNQIHYECV
jgi:hypothetical protein